MRILIASLAALAAIAIAAPSFAQDIPATAPPATKSKGKPRTAAQCNALKTETSRAACLKRIHAQSAPAKATPAKAAKTKTKSAKKGEPAPARSESSAEAPPAAMSAPTSAPPPLSSTGPIAVPPLPQKTI